MAFEMVWYDVGCGLYISKYCVQCTRNEVGIWNLDLPQKGMHCQLSYGSLKQQRDSVSLGFFVFHADVVDGESSSVQDNEFLCNNYGDRNLCQHFTTFRFLLKKKFTALV